MLAALCLVLPSGFTRIAYRLAGYKIGKNVKLPLFSFICAGSIEIGNDVDIRPFVYINIGNLKIGNNTIISFGTQIAGPKGFSTGDNCFIGPHTLIHCEESVTFGFYSGVGPRTTIYTHGSFLPVPMGYPAKFGEVVFEDYVWGAMGLQIMPGTHVGSYSLINPNVVVSGRIPSNTRLQISPKALEKLDMSKLVRFSKRQPEYYHKQIIKDFLESAGIVFTHDEENRRFETMKQLNFVYNPDKNLICLERRNKTIAEYDLENFYASDSSHRIHKAFLFFLRRRYGLTLRIKYRKD